MSLILLAFGWQSGTLLVGETNRVHLRYEAELIRNAIAHQVEQRLEALERLAGKLPDASPGCLSRGSHEALLNRRGFDRRLEEAFAAWQKAGTPSALVLFDLDHFKPINDKGGHALGNRMLQQVAAAMGAETRSSDHAARQGGDEFAMLLPGCKLPQAMRIAEALRTRIETEGLEHEGNTWWVTVSIGVSAFYSTDHSASNVVTRADAASYDAKSQGRNAVVSA